MHKSTRIVILLLTAIVSLSSCVREVLPTDCKFYEGDGDLVTVNVPFRSPDMPLMTRALLNDEQEKSVRDIYVLFFRLSSASDPNPVVVNAPADRYFSIDDVLAASSEANHSNAGAIKVKNIPSGTYYIAAVANVMYGSIDSQDLRSQLDAVENWNDFLDVSVGLQTPGNLSRTLLCMSGYYMTEDGHAAHVDPDQVHGTTPPQSVIIGPSGQLNGYIHLRRLDSHIRFNIVNGMTEGNTYGAPVATKFRVKSWQVVNIPTSSSAVEKAVDASTGYTNSITNISGWTSYNSIGDVMSSCQLDFYMMENRGQSLNPITTYKEREAEFKQPNTGTVPDFAKNFDDPHYINAPQNSAYVVLQAEFQQTMPGGYLRDVNSQYIIHLGYCEGADEAAKSNDFNSRRNTKYVYNVTIVGADEIVVEAERESVDYNNGVEGTVIDVTGGQVIDLDAHYGVFNITLSRKELRNSHFVISSPNGYWSTVGNTYGSPGYPDPWTEDFQHIRISENTAGTTQLRNGQPVTKLVSYSKTYDYDCPVGTVISAIPESSHTLIPVHHEKKQIQDAKHTVPVYDMHSLKMTYGAPYSASNPNGYTSANENDPIVFTVFLNEFYYYYPGGIISKTEVYGDNGYVASNETTRDYMMWPKFVNRLDGRSFMLLTDFRDSMDDDSHYLTCKIHIRQKSIETYFGEHIIQGHTSSDPDLPAAMGLEQINEHHYKNLSGYYWRQNGGKNQNTDKANKVGGWERTKSWLRGVFRGSTIAPHAAYSSVAAPKAINTWDMHVDQETISGSDDGHPYPIFASRSVQETFNAASSYNYKVGFGTDTRNYEVIDVAATRNRDLNRDGIITDDEVRWFAPSSSQYVLFTVGAGALQTPLFDKSKFDPAATYWNANDGGRWTTNFKKVYYNGIFHFLGTDSWYVVSEEGSSTGQADYENSISITGTWHTGLHTQYSGGVRCARYLGVNTGDNGYEGIELPEPVEFNHDNFVFDTRGYSQQMRRAPVSGWLNAHDNLNIGSNGYNSLSDYFQMATENVPAIQINEDLTASPQQDPQEHLLAMMNNNDFCRNYEDPKFGGRGTWRVPNISELSLMETYASDSELYVPVSTSSNVNQYQLLSCTYWYRNEEINRSGSTAYEESTKNFNLGGTNRTLYRQFLGVRRDGQGRKISLIGNQNLYKNYYYSVRCVRDTDHLGNYSGSAEYGDPVNFRAGSLTTNYVGDNANLSVTATMDAASVASVSVKIDGISASSTGSGTVTSTVSGAPVTKSTVIATWTIVTTSGKTLNYRKAYDLPARYWLISNYNYQNRYAYVDTETNRTSVGAVDSRSADDIEAVYKWVFTTTPGGSPVNVNDLQPETTYYMYNAGSQSYISAPTSGNSSFMTVGGTAIPVKLVLRSGYDGFYVIRLNNATNANRNGGAGNFGTWTGTDDGSTYKLTPAVLKGEMPMHFSFASDVAVDGGKVKISATTEATATVTAVKIAGVNATVTGSGTSYTAAVDLAHVTGTTVTTEWSLTFNGQNYTRTKTYTMPDRYNATRLTFAEINAMAEGETKTVIWGNPSNTKPIFVSHNGTSPSYTSLGFNNAATLATAAQNCADNDNYHFVLTKVSGGYTLKSVHGGFSPNRNGGSVQWSATADVLTLTNYTGGSTSAIVEWVPGCSVRIEKSGAWININGPVYNTGAGDWVKFYFYEVETLY